LSFKKIVHCSSDFICSWSALRLMRMQEGEHYEFVVRCAIEHT